MRDCADSIILTLVVSTLVMLQSTFCWSAPTYDLQPIIKKESIQDVSDPSFAESSFQNRMQDQIIQLNGSALVGQVTKKLDSGSQTYTGFTYDWTDLDLNLWSVSAKWMSSKAAWLEGGKKFLIFPENLYEPYYKLSLSHFLDPDDSVAGVTRIDSYKASISVGALDLWQLGRIVNFEMGIHWGIPGVALHGQVGAQWSF